MKKSIFFIHIIQLIWHIFTPVLVFRWFTTYDFYLLPNLPPPKFGTGFLTTLFLDDFVSDDSLSCSITLDGFLFIWASCSTEWSFFLLFSFWGFKSGFEDILYLFNSCWRWKHHNKMIIVVIMVNNNNSNYGNNHNSSYNNNI